MIIGNGMSLGRLAPKHDIDINQRRQLKNVDINRIKDNVILIDELQGRTIEDYTNLIMQPYIDEYNKGKKPSRRINTTYTEWHRNDKNMCKNTNPEDIEFAQEFVICYGNHEDYWHKYFDDNTPQEIKDKMYNEAIEVYSRLTEEFKKRYPHMHIIQAVIHADEHNGSIHTHWIIQSRANEYQRGLQKRISLSRALEQDGFEHIHTTSKAKEMGGFQLERLIRDFRHNVMNPMMEERGFTIKEEEHGKEHIDSSIYADQKKAEQMMEQAEQQIEEATQTIKQANEEKKKVKQMQSFQQTLDKLDNLIKQDFDESQVQKVQVKDGLFGKTKTMVQMPEEQYNALLAESQSTTILIEVEKKVEACTRVIKDHKNMMADTEQYYQHQINVLKDEIKERDSIIEELKEQIKEAKDKIKRIFKFFEEHNLIQLYEQWKTKIMIQKEQSKVHFYTSIDDKEQEQTQTRK